MMVMGGDRPLSEPLEVMTRVSKDAKSLKFRTCGRLYPEDTILEWLSQDLQDMAAELRQFIQEEHPVVLQGGSGREQPYYMGVSKSPISCGSMNSSWKSPFHQFIS
jgi:hypothetical protein